MNQMNQLIIEGNVVREPEKKTTLNGTSICMISIACDMAYKNREGKVEKEVSFFDVDAFGALADKFEKNCVKGREMRIIGRLKQYKWKDETGKTHSRIGIVAEHAEWKPLVKKEEKKEPEKKKDNSVGMEM